MKKTYLLIVLVILAAASATAQGSRKLDKYLNILITGKLDSVSSFSIDKTLAKKAGWGIIYNAFTKAFISNGLPVAERTATMPLHSYALIIDYEYHGTQFSNLRGQIVDLGNGGQIIGTVTYERKFEVEDLTAGIAENIKGRNPVVYKAAPRKESVAAEPQSSQQPKSKEARLRELKDLYEKQLITKEDYEKTKQKILEEQ
ncbi:MAG TPA: SHOCT domain-containing protein [Ferruginibacter sp.]|nr:SHOCT domain-containing protein [Ferruginibacter sp.]